LPHTCCLLQKRHHQMQVKRPRKASKMDAVNKKSIHINAKKLILLRQSGGENLFLPPFALHGYWPQGKS
jgi:hypothetical protein